MQIIAACESTPTIDLDMHLLGEAAFALETKQINETIHAALREVVDARRRLGLLDLAPDLTRESLAADRRGRSEPPAAERHGLAVAHFDGDFDASWRSPGR